jgi:hypothetical protein
LENLVVYLSSELDDRPVSPTNPETLGDMKGLEIHGETANAISRFCDQISVPALHYLSVNWCDGDASDSLSALLIRSSFNLITLQYSGQQIRDAPLIELFERLPSLQNVALSFNEGFSATLLVELQARTTASNRPLLPHLKKLELRGDDDAELMLALRSARPDVILLHFPAPLPARGRWASRLDR